MCERVKLWKVGFGCVFRSWLLAFGFACVCVRMCVCVCSKHGVLCVVWVRVAFWMLLLLLLLLRYCCCWCCCCCCGFDCDFSSAGQTVEIAGIAIGAVAVAAVLAAVVVWWW